MTGKGDDEMQDQNQSLSGGKGLFPWAGGAVAGLAVGALIWMVATQKPAMAPTAAPSSETAMPSSQAPAAPSPLLPRFDTVRAEGDGSVLVAGAAATAAKVQLLVDGAEAARAEADANGKFAAFLSLGPSDKPRVLTLKVMGADGTMLASADNVILAPTPKPAPEPATSAAPAATPDILVADTEGVTKQTPDAPMTEMIIDTIGYDALGNVDIAGRGAAGAFAQLYIDNALTGSAPLSAQGKWRIKLTGIDAGLHSLRVDQLDSAGKVTARVETPFQREAVEKVATATASAPAVAAPEPTAPPPVKMVTITVQPGFTLWAIARENYGDGMLYVRVFQANKDQIRNPDLIYPGQVFTVPQEADG
ncbi:MAG: LysM peptidoglycan-binding domain-containing protein [Rhodobacteraceae bacterium]|nr:LysM peptidoglycan-binding domain-containing protein [Paracoccaceae bacterium]